MLDSGNLDVSFSGLKTAVALRRAAAKAARRSSRRARPIAHAFRRVVDVLVAKSVRHWARPGLAPPVLAGARVRNRECTHA
jgi:tRNA A37 threonylcarbamoyltransferase TsaD